MSFSREILYITRLFPGHFVQCVNFFKSMPEMTSDGQKERVMDECRNFRQDMGKDETTTNEAQMRERYGERLEERRKKIRGKKKEVGELAVTAR